MYLFNRTSAKARALAERMAGAVRAELEVVDSVDAAVRRADIVTCVTSAVEPVLGGSLLAAGAHVNAMGSFRIGMQELDTKAIGRSRVFVDSVEAALAEAGELVAAEAEGSSTRTEWTEIGRVAAGRDAGRRSDAEVTLFKSVGQAAQDVVVAARVVQAAQVADRGVVVEL